MATYTWADLEIPKSSMLADLNGIAWDFHTAREFAEVLIKEYWSEKPNRSLAEPIPLQLL